MSTQTSPRLRKGLSLVTALALSWSSIALAAPAFIKTGTEARSAPFAVAPLVETLSAGLRLQADETATNGWRRVQLPSGTFAFVRDTDVEVDLSHAAPPPTPPTAPAAAPSSASAAPVDRPVEPLATPRSASGRAPLYVSDFGHLAELVKSDPQAFDLANGFDNQYTASSVSIWGGVFGGLALWVLADTALKKSTCLGGLCEDSTNQNVRNIGTALLVLGPLVGWAIRPTRWDQTKVIDAWNSRHPDRPFVDHAGIEAPQ